MQNIEFEKMTDRQALSWLMQPGIKALLYGRDKNTNGALLCAVRALQNKIELEQSLIKEPKKVYGVEDIYFWTFTDDGTKVESGCFDWCCMQAEITNYMEQYYISEDVAFGQFWSDVLDYGNNMEEFRRIVSRYVDFDDALGSGALDEMRLDYVNSIYDFEEVPMLISSDEWKYSDYDIEINDNDEEIICFTFTSLKDEGGELNIEYDPDLALSRDLYEQGIIVIELSNFGYITKDMCTENDKKEIYKLLDIAKEKYEFKENVS